VKQMKLTVVAVVALAFVVSCNKEDPTAYSGPLSPTNKPITKASPKIKLAVARSPHASSTPGRCLASVTISGTTGPDDLMTGLPVQSGVNIAAGESWSGSWIRVVDWRLNPLGVGNQSAIPFEPPVYNHFQMDDAPFDCMRGPDWTFEWIPGGQMIPDPNRPGQLILKPGARKVPILMNAENVTIEIMSSAKVTWTGPDSKGLVHLVMDGSPY